MKMVSTARHPAPAITGGTTTVFVCSGQIVVSEYTSGTAPGSPLRKYLNASYVDEPVLMIDRTAAGNVGAGTDERLYYHRNQQYSVTALTDNAGAVQERYCYTAYGQPLMFAANGTTSRTTSLFGNPYLFTARQYEPETTLHYYRARYFQSSLGRFGGRDVAGYQDGCNLYHSYIGLSAVDPTGRAVWWCSRDLDGVAIGNHTFLVIVPDKPEDFRNVGLIDLYGGYKGITMGGHVRDDCMLYIPYQKADVAACREFHDPDRYKKSPLRYKSGWDLECHLVPTPNGMTDSEFIKKLLKAADNYTTNTRRSPLTYTLANQNCSCWVNSLLGVSGVDLPTRLSCGEFSGTDWGEEDELDPGWFE